MKKLIYALFCLLLSIILIDKQLNTNKPTISNINTGDVYDFNKYQIDSLHQKSWNEYGK